jgi:acetyl-CoA carboxylase carboxyl transferase subunit beta
MSDLKKAACVLVFSEDGSQILAVSRKDDLNAFGIPGGKVDPDESFLDAAIRETLEETGFEVLVSDISKDNPFVIEDGNGYIVHTFLATINKNKPRQETDEKETGRVAYVSRETLFNGPFSTYNRKLCAWYDNLPIEIK